MPSRQLLKSLSKKAKNKFRLKQKLIFDDEKLDNSVLNEVKDALATDSNRKAIEAIFTNLASSEISEKRSIYHFSSQDYLERLEKLSSDSKGQSEVSIPGWMLIATSDLINKKYKDLEFDSVEDVINYLTEVYHSKINYLWNPE